MMVVDLTNELMPVVQGMVALLAVSGAAIVAPKLREVAVGGMAFLRRKTTRPVTVGKVAPASA